ncbi:MAG: hypothetical protein U0559_08345 [Anaerolineae bacterium]
MPTSPKAKYQGQPLTPQADVERVINSAQRLGIEMDEAEALQWLTAMAAARGRADDVTVDQDTGVFGHAIAILDFSPAELARFRRLGALVGLEDVPGEIETALALSGSSAQSKIQTYPGDVDFFQRVNVIAATREAACQRLGEALRAKALGKLQGPDYQFVEIHFGTYQRAVVKQGHEYGAGTPMTWTPAEVVAGQFDVFSTQGERLTITWDLAAQQPGWCKLDWVVADAIRGEVSKASNMLDVTWEAPDGSITPLDGFLDPYFQEVYLDADSIPIFSKLVKHVSADALEEYLAQLRREVQKYASRHPNYGKVAKRLYNIFRLTGHYSEAAFIRELFDEPAALLYQVGSLLDAVEEIDQPGSSIGFETILAQIKHLIDDVEEVTEEPIKSEIIGALQRLQADVAAQTFGEDRETAIQASRQYVINLVNDFFRSKLTALPEVAAYLEEIATAGE